MDDLLKALLDAGSDEAKLSAAIKPVMDKLSSIELEKKAAEEKALREAGNIEELYKIKLDDANRTAAQAVAGKQAEIDKLTQSVGNAKKAQSLAAVAQLQQKIGFHPAAATDILASLQGVEVDDDFNVKVDGGLDAAINKLRETKPYLFLQSQGANLPKGQVGFAGADNPFAADSFNLTKQAELYKQNPELAKAMAKDAGIEL